MHIVRHNRQAMFIWNDSTVLLFLEAALRLDGNRKRNEPFCEKHWFVSAAGRGKKKQPQTMRKASKNLTRLVLGGRRESLLPYRLVRQSVRQANRSVCVALSLVSRPHGICLPEPRFAPAHAGARTWEEFLVSEWDGAQISPRISDVLLRSVLSFHSHPCFVNARSLLHHILVQVLCSHPDPSVVEDVTAPLWQSSGTIFHRALLSKCDPTDC